ncbi:hypothetical protein N7540_002799 [Penicillium herquei]|nr:hypothetical protein N7540_002799 [Penicillium herquei]
MSRPRDSSVEPLNYGQLGGIFCHNTTVYREITAMNRPRIGTGQLIPKEFIPPDDEITPQFQWALDTVPHPG